MREEQPARIIAPSYRCHRYPAEIIAQAVRLYCRFSLSYVDADGMVLDILVQERRNQEAAAAFVRRLVEEYPDEPRLVATDTLAGYAPARKKGLPQTGHRTQKGLNNRAENSHRPTRQRERALRRFRSPEQAQRFLERFGPSREPFCPGRHRLSAHDVRATLAQRFTTWREVTGLAA